MYQTNLRNRVINYTATKNEVNTYIERSPVVIFGKDYKVRIQYKHIKISQLNMDKNTIKIILPIRFKNMENNQMLDFAIDKMYEAIAKQEIETMMEKIRILVGFAPEDYIITSLKGKIAKCQNKTIVLDKNIVKYEKRVIEYILLHQFCHLKYQRHTKRFYELIESYMPSYLIYENKLNKQKINF